ncbi:3-keto-disaccharide hydrolase [Jiulongibacter sediminis]|uniref:Secreted glycosyl hydrolase n=1 Tax=Jiulongibacter sediminis TaxID=1605367 RepID=A0A0P7B9T4_9BACT|nr:DUF1080 domain-containing protein [Jiulongibacter sediminis]KPM47086.1 secreted glycosyl hydrolase [Jiulongibacter sediminis]TBX22429.1 secreted glycosyl hydrolase [Jiulongibacter sediminis]
MKSTLSKAVTLLSLIAIIACQENKEEAGPNTLSEIEMEEGWTLLFDGKTTDGWHLYNAGDVPSAWIVTENGELYCKPDTFEVVHGDLLTDKSYSNFEMKFNWKISEAGNSGVFINVQEDEAYPTAWTTGPEYQLLDNLGIHAEYLHDSTHWAGCLYGFQKNLNTVIAKPAGEWNESMIKQENGRVQFWLNGVKTADQDLTGKEWKEKVANSNFKTFEAFGAATSGHIALQDWAKGVSFQNLKIREL